MKQISKEIKEEVSGLFHCKKCVKNVIINYTPHLPKKICSTCLWEEIPYDWVMGLLTSADFCVKQEGKQKHREMVYLVFLPAEWHKNDLKQRLSNSWGYVISNSGSQTGVILSPTKVIWEFLAAFRVSWVGYRGASGILCMDHKGCFSPSYI